MGGTHRGRGKMYVMSVDDGGASLVSYFAVPTSLFSLLLDDDVERKISRERASRARAHLVSFRSRPISWFQDPWRTTLTSGSLFPLLLYPLPKQNTHTPHTPSFSFSSAVFYVANAQAKCVENVRSRFCLVRSSRSLRCELARYPVLVQYLYSTYVGTKK